MEHRPCTARSYWEAEHQQAHAAILFLFFLATLVPAPSPGSHSYTGEGKNRPTFPGAALCLWANTGDESGCEAGPPPAPLQQHSRCLGGCAHAAPQGTRQAARPGGAQLPHVWLRGGDGAEERLCRTQAGSGARGHTTAPLWLRESHTLTTFASWVRCWRWVVLFCPHEAPPEVRRQCQEPSHHLHRGRNGGWRSRRHPWQHLQPVLRSPCTAAACPP